jgi:hypothetical protein
VIILNGQHGWHRVFCSNDTAVTPQVIEELYRDDPYYLSATFQGDDDGWFHAEVSRSIDPNVLSFERYLPAEEGIRTELNSWAAWVEANVQEPGPLMEQIITTKQLILIASPPWGTSPGMYKHCKLLATMTAGVFQIDGQGFFAADGRNLVREEEP